MHSLFYPYAWILEKSAKRGTMTRFSGPTRFPQKKIWKAALHNFCMFPCVGYFPGNFARSKNGVYNCSARHISSHNGETQILFRKFVKCSIFPNFFVNLSMKNESHRSKSGVLAFAQVAFFSKNLSNFVFEQIWPKSTKLPKISFSADSTYEYPHSFFKFSPKNVSDPSYRCLKSCDFQKLRTIKNFQFWNMNSVWSIYH